MATGTGIITMGIITMGMDTMSMITMVMITDPGIATDILTAMMAPAPTATVVSCITTTIFAPRSST